METHISIENARRNVLLLFLFRFPVAGFSFAKPILNLWWSAHEISVTQIATLVSVFSLCLICFELPSGIVADRFGRRPIMAIGSLSVFGGTCLYLFGDSLVWFVAAEMCFAFGWSLISGTDQALLYDTLEASGETERFTTLWGRMRACDLGAAALFSVLGGYLGNLYLWLPLLVAAVFFFGLFCLTLGLRDVRRVPRPQARAKVYDTLRQSFSCIMGPRGFTVILLAASVSAMAGLAEPYLQPFTATKGVSLEMFGWITGASVLIAALGALVCGRLNVILGDGAMTLLVAFLVAGGFFGLGLLPGWLGAISIWILYFGRGVSSVFLSGKLNAALPVTERVTGSSAVNLVGRLFAAILAPCFAWSIQTGGYQRSFVAAGVFACLLVGTFAILVLRFQRTATPKNA